MAGFSASEKLNYCRPRLLEYKFLPLILVLSLTLNLWGNRWGAPHFWHPDEVIRRSITMASDHTLNPHYFAYGGLHYSVLVLGAIVPVAVYERIFDPEPSRLDALGHATWAERHLVRIIRVARSISAVMSTLVVGITCIIGAVLFDRRVGYLAALFLAVSMSFVAIAHFATVDAPANLWYWLSCLSALGIWKRGNRIWYILAAATAGLAIGTKIDRVIVLVPLLLSHLLRFEGLRPRRMLAFFALILLGFIVANPALIVAPFEFLDGFTRDLFFNLLLDQSAPTSFSGLIGYMYYGLGPPLFATALAGFAYALYHLARAKHPPARTLWLLATFAPYVLVVVSKPRINIYYMPLLFPPLTIFAAYGCDSTTTRLPQRYAPVVLSVIAAIATYSFLNAVALVSQFSKDSRYQASEWIERHVPAIATIEGLRRAWTPAISEDRYHIIDSLPDKETRDPDIRTVRRLEGNRDYQRIRQGILDLEKWAGRHFGFPVRDEPYMAWFDRLAAHYAKLPDEKSTGARLQNRRPDYVVVVRHRQRRKFAALRSPNSGYRLVAEFHFNNHLGIQPSFSFINPRVYIFQREIKPLPPELHWPSGVHGRLQTAR